MGKHYRGISVCGKICSGKGTFLSIIQKLIGGSLVQELAFAYKLKLFARELLCLVSKYEIDDTRDLRTARSSSEEGFHHALDEFCERVAEELFDGNFEDREQVFHAFKSLSGQPHVLEYARKGMEMPHLSKEFGFADIDSVLWADCGKPRQMLQEIGTECVRSIRDSAWVDYAFQVSEKHPEHFFVITDCRFPNEAVKSDAEDFMVIRLEASREIRLERGRSRDGQDYSKHLDHPSETALDDYPFAHIIRNESTVEELEKNIWANEDLANLIVSLRKRSARDTLIRSSF